MVSGNKNSIVRSHLIKVFDELEGNRFIYICAPAGYGKTVAVRQWLDGKAFATAVVSLNEYDNNLPRFCESFCNALLSCQPKNQNLSEIVSHMKFGAAPLEFVMKAVSALSSRRHTVLVIDDLHIITDKNILRILPSLLAGFPDNFQIVLISRRYLPSEFSDLWLKKGLSRVRAEQFLFNSGEILSLYKRHGHAITEKEADDIARFTQGWAIGINALLLSDTAGSKDTRISEEVLDSLDEFIKKHIWEYWDESSREFMLATSQARELKPSLCDMLAGVKDSGKTLDRLMKNGAFISGTGDGTYHYHHLFQCFLKNMVNEERSKEYLLSLINREGEWNFSQKNWYAAEDCFLRSGNNKGIADCFDEIIPVSTCMAIECYLPIVKHPQYRAASDKYPYLLYLIIWSALIEGRAGDAAALLDRYYERQPEIEKLYPVHAYKISHMRIIDFRIPLKQFISEADGAPEFISLRRIRGTITMNMPFAHRSVCDFSELASGEGMETDAAVLSGWLVGEEKGILFKCLMAELFLEQGDLEKAQAYAHGANAEINKFTVPEFKWCAMAALACILDVLGQNNEAETQIKNISSMIEKDKAYHLYGNYNAFLTRRKLISDGPETAKKWLSEHETPPDDSLTLYGLYASFTTCRAYMALGNYSCAVILLTKILELALVYNRPLDIIEARLLLSITLWKKKRGVREDAIRYLEDAVTAAYPYRYTQIFINEAADISGMMQRLLKKMEQKAGDTLLVNFIRMLVLKMPKAEYAGDENKQAIPACGSHGRVKLKYTDKQKAVMKLLCEGKSFREISKILGIALPTLKSHINLIYQKLDVVKKEDAVSRIFTYSLLN
jgi:LuxR family maltose regulon positive regulatory protein